MKRFINRVEELSALEREYKADGSSFVVMYGRRRVGKTELIAEFIRDKDSLYFLATKESEAQNAKAFKAQAAEYLGNELLKSADADWARVFKMLADSRPETKKILIMDEFQYIGQSNPAFPSIMQKIWETVLKNANVMLILCGSLISLMKSQVLDYGSPLYGRRTSQINLKQIEFKYYGDFFPATKTAEELLPYYAVTGGVPKYIEVFNLYDDIFKAIEENVLRSTSFLYEEPYFLLQQEVQEIGSYFSLIKAIAAGNRKLADISSALGVPSTGLTKYLKVLIDLDLVEREVPVTEPSPEKSKSGLYRIKDNYIAFWFKFVYPYQSNLAKGETGHVLERIKQGFVQNFASYIYEDICREKMWELLSRGKFKFPFNKVGSYWGPKTGQTDIVALDTVEKNLIVGECKYTTSPKGLDCLHNLEAKVTALAELTASNAVQFVIFSTAGFTQGLKDAAKKNSDIVLVDKL
ncbi:MAG: ATP-binding protein [Firmicutes bacterium]|nr:ATP-binding protein [Bacillota bacterium]